MANRTTISDDQKRRAIELKNQGWTAKAVAKETGLVDTTITNSWRKWAEELGVPVPEPETPPYNPPGPVESYRLPEPEDKPAEPVPPAPPLAGLQDKRVPVLPLKQMADKPAGASKAPETTARPATKIPHPSPAHRLMQQINAAVWRYLRATGQSLASVDQKMEITKGTVHMLLAVPVKEAVEHEL